RFIVVDDADIDAAVEGARASKFRNTGQACVGANRFYVHDSVYDEFATKLVKKVEQLRVGDGADPAVTMGPLINPDAVAKVESHIADAVGKGAHVLTGGKRHALGGSFFEPTVLTEMSQDALVSCVETFGP